MLHLFSTIICSKPLLTIGALFLLNCHAYSQKQDTTYVPDLETDRPDQTESASVIPENAIQIETGLYFQKDKAGATEILYTAYPTTLVRFGILNWLELRMEGTYQQVIADNENRIKEKGFGPLTFGTKAKLWQQEGIRPQTAIMAMVDLPAGHHNFKPDNPEIALRLLFKNSLSDKVDLNYNLAYGWEEDKSVKSYSVSIGTGLSDRITVFGEVFGDKTAGQKAAHSIDAGIVYLVLPNLQLDLAAGTALNSAAPDYFVLTGVSIRLPK